MDKEVAVQPDDMRIETEKRGTALMDDSQKRGKV